MTRRVVLIPARGGSKRIPRKNIRPFFGKPMIAWSIEAAKASGVAQRVVVSTDDEEIARIARDCGAEVPFMRPAELSDDHATTMDVIVHAIDELIAQGDALEQLCCLYSTAPMVLPEDLHGAAALLDAPGFDYAFSATHYAFPIQRALRELPDGGVAMFQPQHMNTRSQDLEPALHDAGQFYWGRVAAFRARVPIFSERARPWLLPRYRVQDIDTPEDWRRAELMFGALRQVG